MSPTQYMAALVVVFVATTLQGAVGFGAGLLAMPILLQIYPDLVPGPALLATATLNLLVLWTERKTVAIRPISEALAGRFIGTIIAVASLSLLPARATAFSVALVVLLTVAGAVLGFSVTKTRRNMITAGGVSGFSATTAGIGGPPIALMFLNSSGPEIRGSLALYFSMGLGMTIPGLVIAGRFDQSHAHNALLLLPAGIAGYLASRPLTKVIDRGYTRPAILMVSASAAIALLIRLALDNGFAQ